jgi:hypothetical protein
MPEARLRIRLERLVLKHLRETLGLDRYAARE